VSTERIGFGWTQVSFCAGITIPAAQDGIVTIANAATWCSPPNVLPPSADIATLTWKALMSCHAT
jgi:hypothetical protein